MTSMTNRFPALPRAISRRAMLRFAAGAAVWGAIAGTAGAQQVREGDLDGKPVFFNLDRIVVSVFRGKAVDRHEMLLFRLELINTSAITPLERAMPRLRDSFVRIWNRLGSRPDAADKGLDVPEGRRAMLSACDELVGPGLVKAVLVVGQSGRNISLQRGMRS
jgi:hypothetical protein